MLIPATRYRDCEAALAFVTGALGLAEHGLYRDNAARHVQARTAGAEIVIPLAEQSYGGARFSVRDPKGHIWTLGDYDLMALQ